MDGYDSVVQYATYVQPWFAPPAWIFGPVWSVLYLGIVITFGYTWWQVWRGKWPRQVAVPFVINIVANLLFTPVQFGLGNMPLALLVMLVVLGTIPWMMWAVWPHSRLIAYAQVPYLAWVAFATILQASIVWLN
jgi:translocator protein